MVYPDSKVKEDKTLCLDHMDEDHMGDAQRVDGREHGDGATGADGVGLHVYSFQSRLAPDTPVDE